jgi:hypothetical protein
MPSVLRNLVVTASRQAVFSKSGQSQGNACCAGSSRLIETRRVTSRLLNNHVMGSRGSMKDQVSAIGVKHSMP